jgi:hypothetical protein
MNKYPSRIQYIVENFLLLESRELNQAIESILVAMQVFEKLKKPLTLLSGDAGFQSLLSRSLSLAQEDEPRLQQIKTNKAGSIERRDTTSAIEEFDGCGKTLIVHFLGLLITFVGEDITMQILEDIWPLHSKL